MTPDLKARKILMSAHLYYDRNCHVLTDGEFDSLCMEIFEEWDELDAFRQWQLGGDPIDIVTTACHVLITRATVGGAESWYESLNGHAPETPYQFHKKGTHEGCQYTTVSG